jgi:tetratricopeptide (TPR) repeat protein
MTPLLENLKEFYREEPTDPFNIYALATEYLKSDLVKARELFEKLLEKFPNYIATYYHAAALYSQINEMELADITYRNGIRIAELLNKNHALMELKRAYRSFLDEMEE